MMAKTPLPAKNVVREMVPRLSYQDSEADELIASMKPVVLTDTELVSPAINKWDIDYLKENLGSGLYTVFTSRNGQFKYFDENKAKDLKDEFTPPTKKMEMKIWDFAEKLKSWKPGDPRIYLQQPLSDSVGANFVEDFVKFNWSWATRKQKENNWGRLTSNLLLISTEGCVTPVHYDEQHNFFAQIKGRKRFLLYHPDQYECFYPHPVWHPHDRQSQVNYKRPDFERFPKYKDAKPVEAILEPGDVLYLPMYWWHHVESMIGFDYSISVNFWYKGGPTDKIHYPLESHQKMSVMRNIEKMLLETLRDPNEVGPLLRAMVLGRFA